MAACAKEEPQPTAAATVATEAAPVVETTEAVAETEAAAAPVNVMVLNGTTGFGTVFNCSCQVTTQEGAFIDFVVHVDDSYITFIEVINNPLVVSTCSALGFTYGFYNSIQIGAERAVGGGYSATNQLSAIVVQGMQSTLKLALIAFYKDWLPNFLQG